MGDIFVKAITFLLIILLGYFLKKIHLFGPNDYRVISKVVFYITLPAVVITSFAEMDFEFSFLYLILIGLICNLALAGIGYLAARKREKDVQAFYMLNSAGYNIGCFTLPYVQSFLGAEGVVITCMFDLGNSIMCTGGTYAIAEGVARGKGKGRFRGMLRAMYTSVTFVAYIVLLVLAMLGIQLPQQIADGASIAGMANSFCAMFMIGLMLEVKLERQYLKDVVRVLGLRFLFAVASALVFYYCLPFPLLIRQILVISAFSPMAVLDSIFTEKLHGNVAAAGMINSISTIISMICITALMLGM